MTPEDVRAIVDALRESTPAAGVSVDLGAALGGLAVVMLGVLGFFLRRLVASFDGLTRSVATLAADAVTRESCATTMRQAQESRDRETAARREALAEATAAAERALEVLRHREGGER